MPEILYQFDPLTGRLRLRLRGLTNHEIRCVMLGLWRRLEREDQEDFISEMQWYLDRPDSELPPVSQVVAHGEVSR